MRSVGVAAAPHDRGREGFVPSPPSEPYERFSRIRLSSCWFPHWECLAYCRLCVGEQPIACDEGIDHLPPMTPLPGADTMRSVQVEASTPIASDGGGLLSLA